MGAFLESMGKTIDVAVPLALRLHELRRKEARDKELSNVANLKLLLDISQERDKQSLLKQANALKAYSQASEEGSLDPETADKLRGEAGLPALPKKEFKSTFPVGPGTGEGGFPSMEALRSAIVPGANIGDLRAEDPLDPDAGPNVVDVSRLTSIMPPSKAGMELQKQAGISERQEARDAANLARTREIIEGQGERTGALIAGQGQRTADIIDAADRRTTNTIAAINDRFEKGLIGAEERLRTTQNAIDERARLERELREKLAKKEMSDAEKRIRDEKVAVAETKILEKPGDKNVEGYVNYFNKYSDTDEYVWREEPGWFGKKGWVKQPKINKTTAPKTGRDTSPAVNYLKGMKDRAAAVAGIKALAEKGWTQEELTKIAADAGWE